MDGMGGRRLCCDGDEVDGGDLDISRTWHRWVMDLLDDLLMMVLGIAHGMVCVT